MLQCASCIEKVTELGTVVCGNYGKLGQETHELDWAMQKVQYLCGKNRKYGTKSGVANYGCRTNLA